MKNPAYRDSREVGPRFWRIVARRLREGTSLPAKEQAKVDKLSKLSGAAFDRQYMTEMVTDHKKDVAEFQKASKTVKDESVKNFASSTLPTLQDHLKQAQEVHGKVGGAQSASKKSEAPKH